MQKPALILLSFFIFSGCSVFRKAPADHGIRKIAGNYNVSLGATEAKNISNSGFFITKATVEISGRDISEKMLCTVKYTNPGKYLISVRSRAGIEAARLFISEDTVLVNDRINRSFYYGSNEKLTEKYGFSYLFIPLIFGDYLSDSTDEKAVDCKDGLLRKRSILQGSVIDYTIDCETEKAVGASTGENEELIFRFTKFKKVGNITIPEEIEIEDIVRRTKIFVIIEKIEYPWDGNIEFTPGANYEKIYLK